MTLQWCAAARAGRRTTRSALLASLLAWAAAGGCGSDSQDVGHDAERRPTKHAAAAPKPDTRRFVPFDNSGRAVVWAVGDGANGSDAARRVAGMIARDRPDVFLYLGDVYERGTAREFRTNYEAVYGQLAPITAPTPGNHEWKRHRDGYDTYWSRKRGRSTPPYYNFHAGGWELLSLNSEVAHDTRSPQHRWLQAELRGRPGSCRLAFWHRPRYSAGVVHGDQHDMAPIWRLLRQRVALVVNGHEHDLQRLRPIDGIVELVAGAGGDGHYRLNRSDPRLAFGDDTAYGALRLELEPGRARFRFVADDGRVLDTGSVPCR